jgi:hypothetical protein
LQPRPQKLIRKEVVTAKVIEVSIPKNFRKPWNWAPEHDGKAIQFCSQTKKSA